MLPSANVPPPPPPGGGTSEGRVRVLDASVLHVGPERARNEPLMQPVLLAGGPPQGGRRAQLTVAGAQRVSLGGPRHRPAAAHRAPLLHGRLGLQLRLAQLQQRRYLLPQRQGFEPATCQMEEGFHERLQSHSCRERKEEGEARGGRVRELKTTFK